jgi:hypothetical protein
LFEHEAFELPSSTAPARIEGEEGDAPKRPKGRPRKAAPEAIPTSTPTPTASATLSVRGLLTTALRLQRGAGTNQDLYDAGTLRERAYMRSVRIEQLGSAVVAELDEEFIDIDVLLVDDPDTQDIYEWETYK